MLSIDQTQCVAECPEAHYVTAPKLGEPTLSRFNTPIPPKIVLGKQCAPCIEGCVTCKYIGVREPGRCDRCDPDHFLLPNATACVERCEQGEASATTAYELVLPEGECSSSERFVGAVGSAQACADACAAAGDCATFDYQPATLRCWLENTASRGCPEGWVLQADTIYASRPVYDAYTIVPLGPYFEDQCTRSCRSASSTATITQGASGRITAAWDRSALPFTSYTWTLRTWYDDSSDRCVAPRPPRLDLDFARERPAVPRPPP